MNEEKFKTLLNTVKNTAEFTREIGVDRSYYYKLKDGNQKIGVTLLEKIAKYFNKPVGYFFDEEVAIDEQCQKIVKGLQIEIETLNKYNIDLKKEIDSCKKSEQDKMEIIELLRDKIKGLEAKIGKHEELEMFLEKNYQNIDLHSLKNQLKI